MAASTRVVLVHGVRDDASSFDGVLESLGDLDVIAYTRRGWEPDARHVPEPLLESHVEDLLQVLDGGPSVVVGHSWGSHVAFAAAIANPALVRSIGAWEPSNLRSPTWPSVLRNGLVGAIDRARSRAEQAPGRHRDAVFIAEASLSLEPPYDVHQLSVPCVVGVGEASSAAFVGAMEDMAASIGAELYRIPGVGHMGHREDPKAFAGFVRRAVALSDL